MPTTVFAENMGLFHKGSNGQGIAPGDVCLTPPPPPAGPVPVPYVNVASASDLSKGSTTVKIDGEPTALEDNSECSTSTGDEPGQQGGNVITHKTKGKASFKLWSFTVKIEGKGVCRHGDPMGQNSACDPAGAVDMAALVKFQVKFADTSQCKRHYNRSNYGPTYGPGSQDEHVKGKPCWVPVNGAPCGKPGVTADHQPPLIIAWYMGGCHGQGDGPKEQSFRDWAKSKAAVQPQCAAHSMKNPQKGYSSWTRPKGRVTIASVTQKILTYLA
jgi:uncharacterized Zn-binding protein involved in type VI secretion